MSEATASLETGRDAIRRHAWREAFEALSAADREEPLGVADLDALAEAAWWLGRLDDAIETRQRAFTTMVDDDPVGAATMATWLAVHSFAKGAGSVGAAWLRRAEQLLDGQPEGRAHAWTERVNAVVAFEGHHQLEEALARAQRAHEIAARVGDRDLVALTLHDQGRILAAMGSVVAGLRLVDETTAAAVSGELTPWTTAAVYCNTIMCCRDLADYGRAGEWSDAAKRWCERQAIYGFPGQCRVYRAEIMRFRGAWAEAEVEALRASEELAAFNLGYAGHALAEVGEIRLRLGDLDGAEEAFAQAHELGVDPQPGLALLRAATGKAAAGLAMLESALQASGQDALSRAKLLPAVVEVAVAAGDADAARAAAEQLTAIAEEYGTAVLGAWAATARGMVAIAEGDAERATGELREAVRLWHEVDAPFEAARARAALAEALLARGDEEAAALELRSARATFERLGAALDAGRVAQLLGDRGPSPTKVVRTFLFTDIVRSTPLVEAIGDEAWLDLVRWHDRALREQFERYGGEEIDHAGDGFFVAFDSAADAVQCAVAIQRALSDHRRQHGFAPEVRIGAHAAPATRDDAAYRGRGVHEAARIAALAGGGEIVLSRSLVESDPPAFPVSEPRAVTLKGIAEPVEVVLVEWREA